MLLSYKVTIIVVTLVIDIKYIHISRVCT